MLDRLGLGYEALAEINPRLVYGAVRGFGDPRTGESPYADWPAFDVVAQAMSGLDRDDGRAGTFGTRDRAERRRHLSGHAARARDRVGRPRSPAVGSRPVRRRGDVRRARRAVRGDRVPLEPLGSPRRPPRQRASDPPAVRHCSPPPTVPSRLAAPTEPLADPVRGDGAARPDRRRAHPRQPRPQQEPGDGARDHRGVARRADHCRGARSARRSGAGRAGEQQRDAVRRPAPAGPGDARGVPDAGERATDGVRQHADQVHPHEGGRQPAGAAARRTRRRGARRSGRTDANDGRTTA